jgi:replication factor C large subunit
LGYEIIEVNASDFRNKDKINSIIGNAIKQMSLFATSKIILVDEIDGLSGSKDRGGISEITKLIAESSFPVLLTANNPWDNKFSSLRNKTEMIEFPSLDYKDIFKVLKRICDKENISYEDDTLKTFARRCGSDVRAAINDLQTFTNDKKLTKETLEELSDRNKTEKITSALLKIFKTTDANIARNALNNIDEDFDKVMLWIDENLPKEYIIPEDLARAYDKVSKADVFSRRIRRRQHWRFLIYINALLSAGIATAKDEKYKDEE